VAGQVTEALGPRSGPPVGASAFEQYTGFPEILGDLRRALGGEGFDEVRRVGERTFEMRYMPLYGAGVDPEGTLLVALDITERLQIEVDRLLLQEEVIATQEAMLRDLSTPLVPVADES